MRGARIRDCGRKTSVPAALAVYAPVRGRVFFWYLALALADSMLAGFAYDAFSRLL